MKPPTEEIGALPQSSETGSRLSTSANSSSMPKTTNGERFENSKSPISTSTYRETSATPSSNYQDSETTYYELCPHELRVDHENDDQIVIQNLCNRKHEKLNKPCQNGFCYCFTSDSDEVRFTQNKINPKFRHKPRKQQLNPSVVGGDNNAATASCSTVSARNKISSLATRTQNISPPMPISTPTSQDGSLIEQTTISANHKNNTIIKSHRILKPRLHSSIVKSRLRETFDSDPNAPLVRIIQEIHKNVVISEVRINRDKIKCSRHSKQQSDLSIESADQHTDEKDDISSKAKTTKTAKFADKKTQTDNYVGRDSDSRSSSRNGGRLLLKRIGSDAALKLKNSQDPPRKPPRRRFSNSSRSTKFTESSPIIVHEKATSPINMKLLDSPRKEKKMELEKFNDEKFKKNPYRKLRESLPSEKEIVSKEIINYRKTSPSCPTLSELSSLNTTFVPPNSDGGDKDSIKVDSYGSATPNIGWVRPDIVNMIHYEARGNADDFHGMKTQPEPQQQKLQQQQQQHTGWIIPPKRDIDTVDNVKLNAPPAEETEFNNFASSMESKSTPVKSQILSQSNVSNRSFIKDKLLNKLSNSPLRMSKRSLRGGNNDGNVDQDLSNSYNQNNSKEKVIKTTTFRKKATQNTRNFLASSKKKFVRFMFGSKDEFDQKTGKTVATQTFESEIINSKATTTAVTSLVTTTAATNTFINSKQKSIYPSIETASDSMIQIVDSLSQQKQQQPQPQPQLPLISAQPSALSSIDNFDFTRKVDSPKTDRTFQRKLKFSPRKAFKHFGGSGDDKQQQFESYKSYDSDFINGDFRIAAMNDILASLRSKIETTDETVNNDSTETENNHQQGTATMTTQTTIHEDLCEECAANQTQISARADIHTEPIYSEIEDQQHVPKADQSNQSLKEVIHVVVNDDPNAIYAEIHKVSKTHDVTIAAEQKQLSDSKIEKKDALKSGNSPRKSSSSSDSEIFPHKQHDLGQQCNKKFDSRHSSNTNLYQDIQEFDAVSYDEPDEAAVSYRPEFDQNSSCTELENNKQQKMRVDEFEICRSKFDHNISEKSFRCNSCPLPRSKYENFYVNCSNNNFDSRRNVQSENNYPTNANNDASLLNQKQRKLKDRLRLSFHRGKHFLKNETRKLSNVIDRNLKRSNSRNDKLWDQSDLCISQLYASEILNENNSDNQPSITCKIEKAVSICRQMPQFESSSELVEAERLLLFSSLKRELVDLRKYRPPPSTLSEPPNPNKSRIQIDNFKIPIKADGNHDMFFNYFYIGVFVSGTCIKSTQSVEKRNNVVIFSNCNINFDNLEPNFGIRVYVYVLRLRKLCHFNVPQVKSPPRKKPTSNCSSDSGDEMISRFRLQGSFVIIAQNFAPYQMDVVDYTQCDKDKFHLHSSNTCIVPLTQLSRRTNLLKEVQITADIKLVFQKFELKGFLNVEDKNKPHNWNQRWCQLNTLNLCFWDYPQDCNEKESLLELNLIKCISYPIEIANREVCARPKSFSIQIAETELNDDQKLIRTYFLSTDNQKDLNYWINGLNEVIEFVRIWMC